jgi:hypothetical protein
VTITHFNESSVGSPNGGRISGTAGDLYAQIKWAAPQNGWGIEYDDPVNFRLVIRPGTGNRFRLYVNDNATDSGSAGLCIVRGCENATGTLYANLVDPFPTQAQVADNQCNWNKSSTINTTARAFDLWIAETFVLYAVNWSGTSNLWELQGFGDFAPSLSGDSYNTYCATRGSSTIGGSAIWSGVNGFLCSNIAGSPGFWICRTYDGTVKSVRGGVLGKLGQSNIGVIATALNGALAGPTTGIDTEKFSIWDSGSGSGTVSGTLCLPVRGYLPNLLSPQHGGRNTLNTRHSYTESPFMVTGKVVTASNAAGGPFAVVQESDDWVPPA